MGDSSESVRIYSPPDKTEIAMLLECPVCYEIMLPPIFSCAKGHNVCFECRPQVRICPVCRDDYDGSYRNLLAEELASKSRILCKYTKAGCNFITCGNELKLHHYVCSFREVECPQCAIMVDYNDYLPHLSKHGNRYSETNNFSTGFIIHKDYFEWENCNLRFEISWIRCFGKDFIGQMEKHDEDWSFFITCADTNANLKDYVCDITLWNKQKGFELEYKGPINPVRTKAHDVVSSKSGLTVTDWHICEAIYEGAIYVVFRLEKCPEIIGEPEVDTSELKEKPQGRIMYFLRFLLNKEISFFF